MGVWPAVQKVQESSAILCSPCHPKAIPLRGVLWVQIPTVDFYWASIQMTDYVYRFMIFINNDMITGHFGTLLAYVRGAFNI